jgi:hypothetical protein
MKTGMTGTVLRDYDSVITPLVSGSPNVYGSTGVAQVFGYINDAVSLLFGLMVAIENTAAVRTAPWTPLLGSKGRNAYSEFTATTDESAIKAFFGRDGIFTPVHMVTWYAMCFFAFIPRVRLLDAKTGRFETLPPDYFPVDRGLMTIDTERLTDVRVMWFNLGCHYRSEFLHFLISCDLIYRHDLDRFDADKTDTLCRLLQPPFAYNPWRALDLQAAAQSGLPVDCKTIREFINNQQVQGANDFYEGEIAKREQRDRDIAAEQLRQQAGAEAAEAAEAADQLRQQAAATTATFDDPMIEGGGEPVPVPVHQIDWLITEGTRGTVGEAVKARTDAWIHLEDVVVRAPEDEENPGINLHPDFNAPRSPQRLCYLIDFTSFAPDVLEQGGMFRRPRRGGGPRRGGARRLVAAACCAMLACALAVWSR